MSSLLASMLERAGPSNLLAAFATNGHPATVETLPDHPYGTVYVQARDKEGADFMRVLAGFLWACAESVDPTGCELMLVLPDGTEYEPATTKQPDDHRR